MDFTNEITILTWKLVKNMNGITLEEGLTLASYVKSSTYRYKVLESLKKHNIATPTTISKDTGILVNHMSNVLRELKQNGYVECINEDTHKGRLYRLTMMGNLIVSDYLPLL